MNNSSVKNKGIWTWGHVIYDYRSFFRNMKSIGLNRIVIWNDILPLNAKEVLSEAHKNGIKLIWGFSWGWTDKCGENVRNIGAERIKVLQKEILAEFERDYSDICCDGIYFQSFTETDSETVNGISIAETVTQLVNSTAEIILKKYPDTEIEFGLHASSVKNSLDIIRKTDPRIRIVWEDCGAFPFDYDPHNTDGFDETFRFTEKLLTLRGQNEKCGFVFKGMTKLDWENFRYHDAPYTIGEADPQFISQRRKEKEPLWDYVTDGWLKNTDCVQRITSLIAELNPDAEIYALIEDGMFECEIKPPPIIFSLTGAEPFAEAEYIKEKAEKIISAL